MPARRANPNRVKRHRCYTAGELAACYGVHKNTVRHWHKHGLEPIDASRPLLFHGETIRSFLASRSASRKSPCPPGTFYCLRCREPRPPALDMVEYLPVTAASGNLRALCGQCEAMMHRRVSLSAIGAAMPGIAIQIPDAPARLSGRHDPSLNCDSGKRG